MCAKHLISSGIAKVVFLEPYPKSLAFDLHADAIQVESGDRGRYHSYPSVQFEHFYGISPRRYRELFERGRRKDVSGRFQDYVDGNPRPNIDYKNPFYNSLEQQVAKGAPPILEQVGADYETILDHE